MQAKIQFNCVISPYPAQKIVNLPLFKMNMELNRNGDHGLPVPNYTDENVSAKVVKLIQSYTGVVNKMVWRKF